MKNEKKNNNIINFPNSLTNGEREVEAILFAASEPLEIESIEARLNKKVDEYSILAQVSKKITIMSKKAHDHKDPNILDFIMIVFHGGIKFPQ